MSKQLITIYALSIFSVILILNFTYQNSITGAATAEASQELPQSAGSFGLYSIKPNFKAKIDYDLEEYNKTAKEAKDLINLCKNNALGIEACIQNIIETIQPYQNRWQLECISEDEKVFYEFVEKYKLCLESDEKDKICEFSLKEDVENKRYIISLIQNGEKTRIELRDKNIAETIDSNGPFMTTDIKEEEANQNQMDTINLILTFDKDKKLTIQTFSSKGIKRETPFPTKNKISLYKYKSGEIAFIHGNEYNTFKSLKKTFNPTKRIFKFCVNSGKNFITYDENEKTTKLRNVTYKFALYFKDDVPPPPVRNVEIKDNLKSERSVLMFWDRSAKADILTDVKDFIIYHSDIDFKNQEIKDKEIEDPSDESKKIPKTDPIAKNSKIEIEDTNLNSCEIKNIGEKCSYRIYDNPLEKNRLYYWKKENKYIYVLSGLEDNKEYFFGVTAMDFEGNQMNNRDNGQKFELINNRLPKGQSKDDLPPGLISDLESNSEKTGEVTLMWKKPSANIDGSLSADLGKFTILYKKSEPQLFRPPLSDKEIQTENFFGEKAIDIDLKNANCESEARIQCTYTVVGLEPGAIYDFGIIAADDNENFYNGFIPKQGISRA